MTSNRWNAWNYFPGECKQISLTLVQKWEFNLTLLLMHIHVYVNYFSMSLSIFNVENLCLSSLYTFYCQHICNNNTNIIINHNKLHYSPKHGIFIFHFYFLSHGSAFGKSYYSYIQIIKTCGQIAATLPKYFMTVILKLWH